MKIKTILGLFGLLFLFSGVKPMATIQKPKKVFVIVEEMKSDSLEMKLNRAIADEKKSFINRIESTDLIKDELLK